MLGLRLCKEVQVLIICFGRAFNVAGPLYERMRFGDRNTKISLGKIKRT